MEEELNMVITDDMDKVLRLQRHDFINYIQVIRAYLQVGKSEKALTYLDGLTQKINEGTFCSEYFVAKIEEKHD